MSPMTQDNLAQIPPVAPVQPSIPDRKQSDRSLADLIDFICRDARQNTSHYLIRSNTSHDGE